MYEGTCHRFQPACVVVQSLQLMCLRFLAVIFLKMQCQPSVGNPQREMDMPKLSPKRHLFTSRWGSWKYLGGTISIGKVVWIARRGCFPHILVIGNVVHFPLEHPLSAVANIQVTPPFAGDRETGQHQSETLEPDPAS